MTLNSSLNLVVLVSVLFIILTLQNQPVFSEENKPQDIYSTPEYKAASEELNKLREKIEILKQKAFKEDPALKKAFELYEESRKFGTRQPVEWLNSTGDKSKAQKDYRNLKRYWSNYFDYQSATDLSKNNQYIKKMLTEFARLMFKRFLPKKEELIKSKNKNNQLIGAALDKITDINDDEQLLSAYLEMLKESSVIAKEKYDQLLEECKCPENVLDIMKKEVAFSHLESLSSTYKMTHTPEYWKQAKKDYKKKIIAFSKRFPGGLQYEAEKRRKALSEAAEKQKAEMDVF